MTAPNDTYAKLHAAFNRQAWPQVQQLAAQLLPLAPGDAVVHYMAGIAHMEQQQMPAALDYLQKAAQLDSRNAVIAAQYARALATVRQMREARLAADRAMALSPNDPFTWNTLGVVYSQANALEQAASVFQRLVALLPRQAPAHFSLAAALTSIGDFDGAERELETTIELDPRLWGAHLTLAHLRSQTPAKNHIERLQRLLSRPGNPVDAKVYLNMALAKEYEDIADYPKAFEHLALGKSAGRIPQHDAIMRRDAAMFERLASLFPEPHATVSEGDPTDEPIFIIGMPRTGTTLIERIISSHPDVYSAGELHSFPVSFQHASGSPMPILFDPEIFARIRHIDWKKLGSAYLYSTRPATGHTPRFIDKMPHNFLYAGFIARALPNAKIICLRRDPLDTCLSNFRHLFGHESSYYEYTFDLLDTGRYYVMFERLMAHWRRVLPGRILEVSYETLVDTQEASTRQLLAFCGLSWNDACLRFQDNAAPAGSNPVLVRAPVYRTAVKRWKRYEPQLRELQELLAASGVVLAS